MKICSESYTKTNFNSKLYMLLVTGDIKHTLFMLEYKTQFEVLHYSIHFVQCIHCTDSKIVPKHDAGTT